MKGYKLWFYMADLNEPPHVHVGKEGNQAKFWLQPVSVARAGSFRPVDLREIERIIENNLEFLLNAWKQEEDRHVIG